MKQISIILSIVAVLYSGNAAIAQITPAAMNGDVSTWVSIAGVSGTGNVTTSTIGQAEGFNYVSSRSSIEVRAATAQCPENPLETHTRRMRLYQQASSLTITDYIEFPSLTEAGAVKIHISSGESAGGTVKITLDRKNAGNGWDKVEEITKTLPGSGSDVDILTFFGASAFVNNDGVYSGGLSGGSVTFRLRNTTAGTSGGSIYILKIDVTSYNDATGITTNPPPPDPLAYIVKDDMPKDGHHAKPIDHSTASSWQSALVKMDEMGRLTYNKDTDGFIIPDFSHAGYKNGDAPIPTTGNANNILITLEPNHNKQDDRERIQQAINTAGTYPEDENGIRGVVLLKAGLYYLKSGVTLNLNRSGVILRGEGYTSDTTISTVIYDMYQDSDPSGTINFRTTLSIGNNGGGDFWTSGRQDQVPVLSDTIHVGSYSFKIARNTNYKVGDLICIDHPCTEAWLQRVDYGGNTDSDKKWNTGSMSAPIAYHRYITKVEHFDTETKITMDAPVFYDIVKQLTNLTVWRITNTPVYSNIGIEKLRVDIATLGMNGSATDEHHASNAVQFNKAENCWAKDVVTTHYIQAGFVTTNTTRITIENCYALDPVGIVDGERMYNFNFNGNSQLILVKDCFARGGRHNYVSNGTSKVSGIVVYNSKSEYSRTSSEGHRLWTQGMLIDTYEDFNPSGNFGILGFYNRNNMGSGHGWAMANGVMWNCNASTPAGYPSHNGYNSPNAKGWFLNEKPPTSQNYAIGCFADFTDASQVVRRYDPARRIQGYTEGSNRTGLEPRSLYMAQLKARHLSTVNISQSINICTGEPIILTANVIGDNPYYQWYLNGQHLTGATASTYQKNVSTLADQGTYKVEIRYGSASGEVYTSAETVVGFKDAQIKSMNVSSNVIIVESRDGILTVNATGESLQYQWFKNGQVLNGETNMFYNIINAKPADAGTYYVTVKSAVCNDIPVKSDNITVEIKAPMSLGDIVIVTQPSGGTYCVGDNCILSAEITGYGLYYQWTKNGTDIEGATDISYKLINMLVQNTGTYTLKIKTEENGMPKETIPTVVNVVSSPNIIAQPDGKLEAQWDSEYVLTVGATGGSLQYQWYFNDQIIDGASSSSYTITKVNATTRGVYKVSVSGDCGEPIFSNNTMIWSEQPNVPQHPATSYKLYPNPANEKLHLHTNSQLKSLRIYDMGGRLIKSENLSGNDFDVNIISLSPGIYALILETSEGVESHKILKQ